MKSAARNLKDQAGFTLAEVMAALAFMAIVIPVAIAALRVASLSGEVASRKAVAAQVADRVLNEAVVTADTLALATSGTTMQDGLPFRWTVHHDNWAVSQISTATVQMLSVDVTFSAQGQDYSVRLSTLVSGS